MTSYRLCVLGGKNVIRKLVFAAVIGAFLTPVAQASQEKALERQYKKELKKPIEKHSVETLRWVGAGLLNGYVFTEGSVINFV